MSRIRTVKPEFWTNEQIMNCSPIARLLFIAIWNFCDDGGNHPLSVRTAKAEVFPGDDLSDKDVELLVTELIGQGLLIEYQVGAKKFWHVTGWRHQKIDKPTLKYPSPPKLAEDSTNTARVVVDYSTTEGKGEEGKGEDVVVAEGVAQAKQKESPQSRGARLSTDIVLTPEWGNAALELRKQWGNEDAVVEFEAFKDYWHSKPGKDGLKLDWLKTWRNWCRNSHRKGALT
jgi:hypothetical protein